jgi:hypothetical protein
MKEFAGVCRIDFSEVFLFMDGFLWRLGLVGMSVV